MNSIDFAQTLYTFVFAYKCKYSARKFKNQNSFVGCPITAQYVHLYSVVFNQTVMETQ